MKNKKWNFETAILPCIVFGISFTNNQPKKEYSKASWDFIIIIACFGFRINLSYNYKHPKK